MNFVRVLQQAFKGYVEHDSLSRGAAISFYVVTSLAPVLLIVVAIAGIVFGREAVQGSLVDQMRGVFGQEGAEFIQTMLAQSSIEASSRFAATLGAGMVLLTASGVFGEMQAGLNKIWGVDAAKQPWSTMVRARAVSIGVVATLGFLMMVSLAASTAISALGVYVGAVSPLTTTFLSVLNTVMSFGLFTALFAVIFKVLPDTFIPWRDVLEGALITAVLFTVGKSLIGWYLGVAGAGSGYGAAGAVILILFWSYYSAQIFLFGAEITRAVSASR